MHTSSTRLQIGDCTVDLLSGHVVHAGHTTRLSATELALVAYLAARPGQAVSRDELLAQVWNYDSQVISRTVDAAVRRLRKKIESRPSHPVHLVTVHGAGYRLEGVRPSAGGGRIRPVPSFRGRERLLDEVRRSDARVLTLTGAPGVGKSELAAALTYEHEGTVLWVDLSQVAPDFSDLAAGLGLQTELVDALPVLPQPLLVLDDAASHAEGLRPRLDAWLAQSSVRVLCTSRRPLAHRAEEVVQVPGLDPDDALALLGCDGPAAERLIGALEHNPLALTLAREPCQLLGPEALLDRLETHGAAFGQGQGRLDAAVEASWRLLEPGQQRLLSVASLAPGGLPLQVLESWFGEGTLGEVQVLLRHALVRVRAGAVGPRIEVPFPVWPFAQKRARSADPVLLQEHLVAWARCQYQQFHTAHGEDARAALRAEAPTLRACSQVEGPKRHACLAFWSLAVEDVRSPVAVLAVLEEGRGTETPPPALAWRLGYCLVKLGRHDEAIERLEPVLAGGEDDGVRLALLDLLATVRARCNQHDAAARLDALAEQVPLAEAERLEWLVHRAGRRVDAGDAAMVEVLKTAWAQVCARRAHRLVARVAFHLAAAYSWRDDLDDAIAVLREAIGICEPLGDWYQHGSLLQMASQLAADTGRTTEATELLNRAERVWRALGRAHRLDKQHMYRARVAFLEGRSDEAIAMLSRGIARADRMGGYRQSELLWRGMIRSHVGQYEEAIRDLRALGEVNPAIAVLRHATLLLSLLRLGKREAVQQELARSEEVEIDSLARYQALAHAGVRLYLGESAARETLEAWRGRHPPCLDFKVLWGHLDWVLAQSGA